MRNATGRLTAKSRILKLLYACFLLIGVVTVLLGQILPVLAKRLALDDRAAGYLFVAQFAGSLAGTSFYNRLIAKIGYLRTLMIGFCLMVIGCASLNFDSAIFVAAAIFVYGIGIGLTIPAINLLVIELNPEKSSSASNTLNFFWGFGAILCKPFVDFVGTPDSILLPTMILCAAFLIFTVIFGTLNFAENFRRVEQTSGGDVKIWTTRAAWLIAVFSFIHVGIESGVGGWITTYESRLSETANIKWLSAAVVYFTLLVAGRAIAPLFFRFLSDNTVLLGSLLVMTIGICLILWIENFGFLILGAAILGYGTSVVYPTNISRFARIFGAQATQRATPVFVFGSLGGAFVTWLIGFVSTAAGNLRVGFTVILVSCLMLVALQIWLSKIENF